MANDFNVILVDDDERNARPVMFDGRPPIVGMPGRRPGWWGGRLPGRPVYYPAPQPQPTVIYQQAPAAKAAGLAGMTTAELVEVGAQLLAAIQPLPAAPTAAGELETDVENLVIYQTALATHAKRDEQLRTLGSLLGRLLRK
jgi:hypothetical protein